MSLSTSTNNFAIQLFRSFASNNKGNIFISPYSISNALAILTIGCEGDSLKQLLSALEWSKISENEDQVIEKYQQFNEQVSGANKNKLAVANSLWANNLLPAYVNRVKKNLGDCLPLSTAEEINQWTAAHTENKIEKIVNDLSPETAAVIVNAIYFKGSWQTKFDPENTRQEAFHTNAKDSVEVALMTSNSTNFNFKVTEEYSAVELFYADKEFSMVLIKPEGDVPLEDFIKNKLTPEFLVEVQEMRNSKVIVRLPKFKLEFGKEIKQELGDLGITQVYVPGAAGLGRLTDDKSVYVSDVIHKAVCEVNEEGTEAAAATAVVMARCLVAEPTVVSFDRPFLFFIKDTKENIILFVGSFVNPSQ